MKLFGKNLETLSDAVDAAVKCLLRAHGSEGPTVVELLAEFPWQPGDEPHLSDCYVIEYDGDFSDFDAYFVAPSAYPTEATFDYYVNRVAGWYVEWKNSVEAEEICEALESFPAWVHYDGTAVGGFAPAVEESWMVRVSRDLQGDIDFPIYGMATVMVGDVPRAVFELIRLNHWLNQMRSKCECKCGSGNDCGPDEAKALALEWAKVKRWADSGRGRKRRRK